MPWGGRWLGAQIDIEDDGTVYISSVDAAAAEKCRDIIEAMTAEVKVGKVYTGKVVSIKEFGAFVEIAPETDGLCHLSELSNQYVDRVDDYVKMGDEVKVILIDDQGRIKLLRKAAMEEFGESDPEPVGSPRWRWRPRGWRRTPRLRRSWSTQRWRPRPARWRRPRTTLRLKQGYNSHGVSCIRGTRRVKLI